MYIVMEIQTNDNGAVGTIVYQFDTLQEAEAKYHALLAVAATSALPVHSAVILTNAGTMVKSEFYRHGDAE